jgi:hypothetical protein
MKRERKKIYIGEVKCVIGVLIELINNRKELEYIVGVFQIVCE